MNPVSSLEDLIGHRFADPQLALRALTHASWTNEHPDDPHNEVLEFVGDAVIQLCFTVLLVDSFPDLREGALTTRRQTVVRGASLARIGRAHGLPGLLRLGAGESKKAEVQDSIVADAVEAVFGALYRDGGFEPCLQLAEQWLAGPAREALDGSRPEFAEKPAKNQLQEWLQQRGLALPDYRDLGSRGPDHERLWTCQVQVGADTWTTEAPTKQAAQELCARLALASLRHKSGA